VFEVFTVKKVLMILQEFSPEFVKLILWSNDNFRGDENYET